ncbi:MAG: class I adenylate-forming enzyme family protein [Longimicrobiales bacterium]|nr:class I adenylate-forming enzyme family protein [Longimicrobiales bacterium]
MANPLPLRLSHIAARLPGKVCLVGGDRRVTFGELDAQVRSAQAAVSRRVAPGERVAVLAENSPEYVAACYGAWRAGAAVVGLNTALKAPSLAAQVRHAGANLLIVDSAHPMRGPLLNELAGTTEVLEVVQGRGFPAEGGPRGEVLTAPGDAASIIYTSGTTGHPKGVTLTHGNLAENADAIISVLGVREDDVALCVLPFQYSYGASVLNTHLAVGATVVMERSFLYPHGVLQRMVQEGATSFAGVPSTFYLLLERTELPAFDLSSLRYVTQAGGPMDPRKIREFRAAVPHVDFFVMYGQTEASARLTTLPPGDLERKEGSAGLPLPGVRMRVLDESGQAAPPGELGEVHVSGPNVMRGYWNDPEETAAVLRDGWLRTGDVGYLDEEGYLFLTGRSSEMIKSGAHRIAPGQVEEVVRAVDGVVDVAVAGIPDELLGQAVAAWVIAREPGPDLRQTILRRCAKDLPRFMVPSVVTFVESLPRTASGKVRKHLLNLPEEA